MTAVIPTIPYISASRIDSSNLAYIDSILQWFQILVQKPTWCSNEEIRSKSVNVGQYRVPIIRHTEQT